jgi:hypothetical protein
MATKTKAVVGEPFAQCSRPGLRRLTANSFTSKIAGYDQPEHYVGVFQRVPCPNTIISRFRTSPPGFSQPRFDEFISKYNT